MARTSVIHGSSHTQCKERSELYSCERARTPCSWVTRVRHCFGTFSAGYTGPRPPAGQGGAMRSPAVKRVIEVALRCASASSTVSAILPHHRHDMATRLGTDAPCRQSCIIRDYLVVGLLPICLGCLNRDRMRSPPSILGSPSHLYSSTSAFLAVHCSLIIWHGDLNPSSSAAQRSERSTGYIGCAILEVSQFAASLTAPPL